jgi:hypothetical protein
MSRVGLLTDAILDQFRATEITSLKLTASLNDENGLNLAASDILPGSSVVFGVTFADLPSSSWQTK